MNKEYSPLSYSEARHYTDMTKKMPRDEVEFVQRLLQRRALEAGVCSPDVLEVISSITDRFFEEDREMRRKAIEEDLRKRGVMEQTHIDADDDHIVLAIKWTLPKYHSDWDWGGIYRILVDFCDFPVTKTDFVRRMARMGIYAQDNYVKNLDHPLPPAIRGTEWHEHQFSYQAVQRGVDPSWPPTYYAWKNSDITTRNFTDRLDIATIFLRNLFKATKEI